MKLQDKNTVRCLRMRVLQMLQMLQRFFALATQKRKFETEEAFADVTTLCYDRVVWWACSPPITNAVHGIWTDYTFCDGHVYRWTKNTGAGWKPRAFCHKRKFRWKKTWYNHLIQMRVPCSLFLWNISSCPKVRQMFWWVQMGLRRKT